MSSYGHLTVDGREIFSFRNEVDPTFMLLFRRDELRRVKRKGAERPSLGYMPDEEFESVEFVISAAVLRERLDVLGLGMGSVNDTFAAVCEQKRDRLSEWIEEERFSTDLLAELHKELDFLSGLDFDAWQSAVRAAWEEYEPRGSRASPGSFGWLLELWEDVDPRLVLRAIVATFSASEVVLDVTDLEGGGWFDTDEDPRELALVHYGWVIANGAPVIVLTEGSSDVAVLSAAVRILRPHLEGFLRFPDFSVGAEGGSGALVRLLKALWAAGVANRVIALFDNDTAAGDALRGLDSARLPPNLRVLRLPDIEMARRYPTVGPSGVTQMDVNGLAGSIELYLGADVLMDDGELRPVQWTGFNPKLGRTKESWLARASCSIDSV